MSGYPQAGIPTGTPETDYSTGLSLKNVRIEASIATRFECGIMLTARFR
jgi:hypothetical protein